MSEQQPGRPGEPEAGAVSASEFDVPAVEPAPVDDPLATQPLTPIEPVPAEPLAEPFAEASPEPTPVVGVADATFEQPAGTAQPAGSLHAAPAPIGEERPEVLVGAAFGGGLFVALFLKRLARRKHR